tara:strand:+ start:731 stop:1213 length:483 start_codon:yes stop_codon:yes gene_type:complete
MKLKPVSDNTSQQRINAIMLLMECLDHDILLARDVESSVHDAAVDIDHYKDLILKSAINCKNKKENASLVIGRVPDTILSKGTILEQISNTEHERKIIFEKMLQEKFDSINSSASYDSSLKCRRCNSIDVTWDQKQTRSADEGMTVYCLCANCNLRWTMR